MRTEDEVVLRELAVADLLVQRLGAVVDVDVEAELGQLLADLRGVLLLQQKSSVGVTTSSYGMRSHVGHRDGNDQHLARREPERPAGI